MRIESFLQTPFISYDNKNMLYIRVEDWDMCNPYEMAIFVGGNEVYSQRIFAQEFSAMIPCYEESLLATVRVTPFESLPVEREFVITPQKHWTVPLLYSSHEDLGYCAYIEKLHYESYEYLKKAMELCTKHDDFRYMIEHFWWLDAFDCYATDEEKRLLKKLFDEKKIDLNAIHSGVHTSWANSEQLVRQMYFGCIEARQMYDVSPKCAFYADISGASSSIINAYASMGIKYVGFFPNSFRNSGENRDIPPIFWWQEKNGENKLLLWHQRAYRYMDLWGIWCDTKRQYDQGEFYFDETKAKKTERWLSEKISGVDKYGYDIFPVSFYDDRELPTDMLLTVCNEMNKRWKYPRFKMEIPSVFMQELEDKFGDKIPTLKGEINDQWADFATIAPNMMSEKRNVMRMLYDAEMLSAVEAIKNNTKYNSNAFRDIYFSLCEFDEHCWATSSKHPQQMHRHNIEKVKKEPIEKSSKALKEILASICLKGNDDKKISVTNTVPGYRKSHIRVSKDELVPKGIKHQILPDQTVVTEAIVFECAETKCYEGAVPSKKSTEINESFFETEFYKVKVNLETQRIVSLVDKETGNEYLDEQSRFELGQFVYAYTEHKTDSNLSFEIPAKIDFKMYDGDVAYVIVQRGYEEQSGAGVTAQFVFYKNEKTIDVDLSYENASGLIGDFYDRYKKNYFFAFPFKVNKPRFYTELAVGEKNEAEDIIPLNANDFSVTQNWVAAENDDGGVAIYTKDMPVFHLGNIKYNRFNRDFCEDKAGFYLYASSNRCNNLIYKSIDDCYAKYRISILTYSGKHNDTVPVWSNNNDHGLIIGNRACEEGTLKLSKSNVRLVSFKKAQDCSNAVVLRFTETAGRATECELELPFKPIKAVYATNDERTLNDTAVNDCRVQFKCSPYSYVTIKVFGDFIIEDNE